MQPTQTEAIKRFLNQNTYDDLANLYSPKMEVQLTVQQGNGERLQKEFQGRQYSSYTDGLNTWYPIRIPKNAGSNPEYDLDKIMTYDLTQYVEGIGLTGWNWVRKKSIYFGFDFDALLGHSEKHNKKLSPDELNEITNQLYKVPYCTIRKSTSGKGLHLYIFIDPNLNLEINNHHEHAALARSILGQLSAEVNFDFSTKVDAAGGILWVYHRKMIGTDGLRLIKKGNELKHIPANWRDHIQVVSGKKNKTLPNQIQSETQDSFELVTGQRNRIKLDKEHHRLLDYLRDTNFNSYWDAERWMLVSHTYALKQAHEALGLRGNYTTISEGTDPTQNIFMFPLSNGGWVVRRFTPGVAEANTWEQDNSGYTRCYFNSEPNVYSASKSHGGLENKSGAFVFNEVEGVINAAKDLGIELELPPRMIDRKARMKHVPSTNKLIIDIEFNPNKDSANEMDQWYQEGKYWTKIFYLKQGNGNKELETFNYDDTIRHIISEDGKDLGWFAKSQDKTEWHNEPLIHVKTILEGPYGYSPKESKIILGSNIISPWTIVNKPFVSEYPGERLWNRDAAQFRYSPSNVDSPTFPTWSKILNHLGHNLDSACKANSWCQKNGILTGADYILIWVASMFQQPYEPLPYLFFYGPENAGKSIFHEALSLLITNGYHRIDSALKSTSNFNGELANAILCVVEETNLKRDKNAAAKIKDWTTSVQLPIHAKGRTPYMIPNTTHYIQCSNDFDACPIFTGDSRITMIKVDPLIDEIPKREIKRLLEKEAPDFLCKIKNLELPFPVGRLGIPILNTEDKKSLQDSNRSPLEIFLEEKCFYCPGKSILYSDLYKEFKSELDPQECVYWSIRAMGKHLNPCYPKGRLHGMDSSWRVGNISLIQPTEEELKNPKFILKDNYLVLESEVSVKVIDNGKEEKW